MSINPQFLFGVLPARPPARILRVALSAAVFFSAMEAPAQDEAPPVPSQNPPSENPSPQLSSNALDLCGKWKVESNGSSSERTFEFFSDGRATDTLAYKSSSGESVQTYHKVWKIEGFKVLILPKGDVVSSPSSSQSIFIEIPFDTARLQITEIYQHSSYTRQTKMVAVRTEMPPPQPSGAPASIETPPPPGSPASKPVVAVVPSIKNSSEGYYKIQRIALNIALKNSSMKGSTGPLKVSYWVLGKNTRDSKQFCVFSKGQFDCTLGSGVADREFKRTTETYLNKYYSYSSSGSFEYAGWIVTVADPAGSVILVKANKPQWEKLEDKLPALEPRKVYDLELNKTEGAYVPMYGP